MNGLLPIIRRVRRPLMPVDVPAVSPRLLDEERDSSAVVPVLVEFPRDYVDSTPVPVPLTLNKRAKSKTVSQTA